MIFLHTKTQCFRFGNFLTIQNQRLPGLIRNISSVKSIYLRLGIPGNLFLKTSSHPTLTQNNTC